MDRRTFLMAGGFMFAASSAWAATKKIGVSAPPTDKLHDSIARIEAASGGRLGVALHDTGTGRRFAYRGDERFAMCSTFKLALAGAVLARVQQGTERLDRRLKIRQSDGGGWAPFTKRRAGGTASVAELCRAMTVESDNGAANVMLAEIGGPAALTSFLRQMGDTTTRFGQAEPLWLGAALTPTTPSAMQGSAEQLWLGPKLAPAWRKQLINWAIECGTGRTRLRAGLPAGWRAGNKTGTGDQGTYNDVAIFWPPNRKPVVVASYLTGTSLATDAANAIHAKVARALVTTI